MNGAAQRKGKKKILYTEKISLRDGDTHHTGKQQPTIEMREQNVCAMQKKTQNDVDDDDDFSVC